MWLTFFYSPLIPIVLVFSGVNFIFTYFVEKYTLLNRSSVKDAISKHVSIEMIEHLEHIIVLYAIGDHLKIFFCFLSYMIDH